MEIYQKRQLENNQQYKAYEETIDSIQSALRREISHLVQEFELSAEEAEGIEEFIKDRATVFRFLRKNNYSLTTSISLLLDTIRWRILAEIDSIRVSTVRDFLNQPLVYFHKTDKFNRPILIVNLAYLPQAPMGCDVTEFLTPLVIFVLETARLLIWDKTRERIELGILNPLVMDIVILVEFKNATSLPMDITLLKSFVTLLRRYPGLTGTVNLLNFGWMYQGLWQMCKLILSEEAKSKVNFPRLKDLKETIEEEDLIIELGGKDEFIWDSTRDEYYAKYRKSHIIISRRNSNCSIYYDSIDHLQSTTTTRPTNSLYATPIASLTPVTSHTNLNNLAKVYSNLSLQTKLGNNISPRFRSTLKKTLGDLFVTPSSSSSSASNDNNMIAGVPSWVLSEKLNAIHQESNNSNNNNNNNSWLIRLLLKSQHISRQITLKVLRKLIRYKSTFYWVIACFLLRNGVQELIQHVFMLMMQVVLDFNSVRNTALMSTLTRGQMTL
ncbi:CRAL-TRIO domain-containing protein [Pilaira anomala]|nr:CRAL-TRIO domain-containing protein [Pilaira anomala]